MKKRAPSWVYNLYGKYGESFAAFISDKPLIKKGIKLELLPSHQAVGNPKVHAQLDRFYESYRLSLSHLFQ